MAMGHHAIYTTLLLSVFAQFYTYTHSGLPTFQENLHGYLGEYSLAENLTRTAKPEPWNRGTLGKLTCVLCKGAVDLIQSLFEQQKTKNQIANAVRKYCIDLKIEDERVCTGIVNMFQVIQIGSFQHLDNIQ